MHLFTKPVVLLRVVVALLAIVLGTTLFFTTSRVRPALAATAQTYIVLYKGQAVPADAVSTISQAGGTLVYSYPQIGVVIASSGNTAFRDNLLNDSRIQGASSTAGFATQLNDDTAADSTGVPTPSSPAPGSDPLSGLQWDMNQISDPQARAINGGSPSVTVGDIDTGLDFTHPDLAPNVDFAKSVSCISGVPDTTPSAWMDDNGHGTHTAGIIAAAKNGIGIVGVAPNVKIAGIKAGNAGQTRVGGCRIRAVVPPQHGLTGKQAAVGRGKPRRADVSQGTGETACPKARRIEKRRDVILPQHVHSGDRRFNLNAYLYAGTLYPPHRPGSISHPRVSSTQSA